MITSPHTPEIVTVHMLDEENGCLTSQPYHPDVVTFDTAAYSRMKFGDRCATELFAHQLAQRLIEHSDNYTQHEEAPLFAVAYKFVPPACYYLSRLCLDKINEQRAHNDLEPGRIIHVYKDKVTATNYAQASSADRQEELASIGFTIESRTVHNQHVTVLDDVRITGGAEKVMVDLFNPESIASLTLGYVALLNPAVATTHPSIEHDLNTAVVRSLDDVAEIIESNAFDLNIRTLKFILGSEPDTLSTFFERISEHSDLLRILQQGAINTGSSFMKQYAAGLDVLNKHIRNVHGTEV